MAFHYETIQIYQRIVDVHRCISAYKHLKLSEIYEHCGLAISRVFVFQINNVIQTTSENVTNCYTTLPLPFTCTCYSYYVLYFPW